MSKYQNRIIDVLVEHGELGFYDLAHHCNTPDNEMNMFRNALQYLINQKKVGYVPVKTDGFGNVVVKSGYYFLDDHDN